MKMIKIFTDTSANLTAEIIKKYKLGIIAFSYRIGAEEFKQSPYENFDGASFYASMREGAAVNTAMINPATFEEAFDEELKAGNDVLYIGMSGGISGTAAAARSAAEELRERFPERRLAVVDTLGASLGEGLLVIRAAQLLEKGVDFDEIYEFLCTARRKMCQYFTVGDLEYLKRGGRISRAATVIGTVLKIKPILTGNDEGKIVLCNKARGEGKALDMLAEFYDRLCEDKNSTIGIAHADNETSARLLEKRLRELGLKGECITVQYEPVTGAHVGPDTVALFFEGIHK